MSEETPGGGPPSTPRNAALKATIREALKRQAEDYPKWVEIRKRQAAEREEQERWARAVERSALDSALAAGLEELTPEERRWLDADPARRDDLARRLYMAHADLRLRLYQEAPKIADGTASREELARWHSDEYREARARENKRWAEEVDALASSSPRVLGAVRRLWERNLKDWEEAAEAEHVLSRRYDPDAEADELAAELEQAEADRRWHRERVEEIRAGLADGGTLPMTRWESLGGPSFGAWEIGPQAEVEGAALWGSVLATWREEVWAPTRTPPSTFRVPGALMSGRGMVAGFFGRKLVGTQSTLSKGGRISALRLDAHRTQLELLAPNRKDLTDPSPAEIFQAFGEILGNREWRTLQACFCAAHEDEASGEAPPGKFWVTPARFAGLLGIPRESGGRGAPARVSKPNVRALDESVANLSRVKGTATFKVRGKDLELEFTDLVREDGLTLAERGHRRGRRPTILYRLNEGLRALMESRIVNLPREALAAPLDPRTGKQVPQDVWDDAFKIFTLLAGHARSNAPRAKTDNPLPWTRNLDSLLGDANLAGSEVPARKVRARGLERLDDLHRAGLVSFVVDGQGEEAMLRYDLPTVRPSLSTIPGRRVVEALPSSSSGKAPRKRRAPRGGKPTGRPPGRTGGA